MTELLRKALKFLTYLGAGIVILLAVAVGLFRLLLPRLPEYQEDIKTWASNAIGMDVGFAGMNARWRLSGPELNFYDARLSSRRDDGWLLEAGEVTIGVGLVRLLVDRTVVADRVLVRDTELDVVRQADGGFAVQGLPLDEIIARFARPNATTGDITFEGRDISVSYRPAVGGEIIGFTVDLMELERDEGAMFVEASLDLPRLLGSRLDVSADQRFRDNSSGSVWQFYVEGREIGLPGWSRLLQLPVTPIAQGTADASIWLELVGGNVSKATVNLAVDDILLEGSSGSLPLDLDGRLEYSVTGSGWLLAAENFRMRGTGSDWPESTVQLQLINGPGGELETLIGSASYLNLDDLSHFRAWLPERLLSLYSTYQPEGEVRDLRLDLAEISSGALRFDVAADLVEAGLNAHEAMPGVRGFTGTVRANRLGGRIEINSVNMRVEVPEHVPETLIFDDAVGTVIWRQGDDGITVLSDSVWLRNADFDSRISLQIELPADGSAPVVDLDSQWSVHDIASAKRFLPDRIMSPALYAWFDNALVSGTVTNGSTRLTGPLDRFPFDAGDGRFLVEARVENAVLRYASGWPDLNVRSGNVVIEGLHLYSRENSVFSLGNVATDGHVDIRDLREPVLEIDAFASGSLESVRQFARQSPIATVFGGQLERVHVEGGASFRLELNYPIKDRDNYTFTTRIQATDGTLAILGFAPTVSELNGIVTVTRDNIESESLFGRFLGEPVSFELHNADPGSSNFSVVAEGQGRVTAQGLVNDLGLPLGDRVSGSATYAATIRFPRRREGGTAPLQIAINSDLSGIGVDFPAPAHKAAETSLPIALLIEFPSEGQIASNGSVSDDVRWSMNFRREAGGWDFDRGTIALGGEYPGLPGSRGLHIQGNTSTLRFSEWLALAGRGDGRETLGSRVRSLDLTVDDLYLFGQHLEGHHVVADRGGSEWVLKFDGANVKGSAIVPYDLQGDRPIDLDMERLVLPGGDEPGDGPNIDPRRMPSIRLRAREFGLGQRFVGSVEAELARTPDGLHATGITTSDPSFSIEAEAGWVVDPFTPSGQRSYVKGVLVSNDVEQTMRRLNYSPGIDSDSMRLDIDVNWTGGPREDFVAELDGSVAVRIGTGQLNEVEPGAGRVFGLMSIVALPRRLGLDFRDVFEKGLGFDVIRGSFRVDDGDAYTCDLSLEGPAADVGIVGRAGLAERDYNQTAIVSANVGNTLPVVGAVVAGPQVAAALLIFSQIFKKPLQEMGQIYYGIDGSFDDPSVEVADARRFAATSELAGCLAVTQ
ncbi:MAG: YhdP family protein [Gammaproteobacteria bacterium]|nr:YhdP family protein [Gammaproteobacteria bacterium]MDH4253849.1 YhdP family protein [Gammaproteobacteria bacterium]MDH5310442.1 YhdP family protein [Gammaproteobacteria bacterium]